jgi:uncharacterized protein VirK/YbjX
LHQILYWDFEFRTVFEEGSRLALSIGTSRPFDNEGELSLLLKMDGEIFFTLSFTIVPGWIVKSKATEVLLISRLQGVPGYSPEQTRLAIKTMHEVRPRALLLSALEGVAIALGIQEIVSVSAGKHIDYCEDLDTIFRNSYDAFFSELGLVSSDEGFFTLTVPIEEKPLSLIKQGHKIRTRKKRAFRKQVQMACSDGILKMTGRAKEASAMNNENVPPEINEFDVKYVITRTVAVGQAKLPHPASRYLADEKSFG